MVTLGVIKLFREMVREEVFQPLVIKEKLFRKSRRAAARPSGAAS